MSAREKQVGGTHYRDLDIQPWDAMKAWMTPAEFRGFLRGNAIKYLARYDKKGFVVEDLRKARHYIERLIEEELEPMPLPRSLEEVFNREATRRARGFHPQEVPSDES